MQVLAIYGSNTGNTKALMTFIKDYFKKEKINIKLLNAENITQFKGFNSYDVVILSSPTWGGAKPELQDDFAEFWQSLDKSLIKNKKFAVIGLGDLYYPYFCKAVDFISDDIIKYQGNLVINSLAIPDSWYNNKFTIEMWLTKLINIILK